MALALRTSFEANDRIREAADDHTEARAALRTLESDLSGAFLSATDTEHTQFHAEASDEARPDEPFLTFTTLAHRTDRGFSDSPRLPRPDAVLVEYRLRPKGNDPKAGEELIRNERWLTETGPGDTSVVCDRVAGLHLRYLSGDDSGTSWSDAEPDDDPAARVYEDQTPPQPAQRRLPEAVEIVLLLAPSSPKPDAKPRVYRTTVRIGAEAPPPREPEVVPVPQQGTSPQSSGGASSAGGSGQ